MSCRGEGHSLTGKTRNIYEGGTGEHYRRFGEREKHLKGAV